MPDPDFFDPCFGIIVELEGKHSDDSRDPGGDTWYGLARASHPDLAWPPTRETAWLIYRNEYWYRFRCDQMPWPWCLAVFDAGVNQTGHTAKMLQAAVGATEDGVIGPETIEMVQRAAGNPAKLEDFFVRRESAYRENPNWPTFGRGWLNRIAFIKEACQQPPPATAAV